MNGNNFMRLPRICFLLLPLILPSGCKTLTGAAKSVQPKDVRYYAEDPRMVGFTGFQRWVIEAPLETTTHPDGTITTKPLMRTLENGTQEPILPEIYIKDVTVQPPKTWLDFGNSLVRGFLAYGLGLEAFRTVQDAVDNIPQSPALIPVPEVHDTVVTPRPSGSFDVQHFD